VRAYALHCLVLRAQSDTVPVKAQTQGRTVMGDVRATRLRAWCPEQHCRVPLGRASAHACTGGLAGARSTLCICRAPVCPVRGHCRALPFAVSLCALYPCTGQPLRLRFRLVDRVALAAASASLEPQLFAVANVASADVHAARRAHAVLARRVLSACTCGHAHKHTPARTHRAGR